MAHTTAEQKMQRRIIISYRSVVLLILTLAGVVYTAEGSDDRFSWVAIALIVWAVGRLVFYLQSLHGPSVVHPPRGPLPPLSPLLGGTTSAESTATKIASINHLNVDVLTVSPVYSAFSLTRTTPLSKNINDTFSLSYLVCAIDLEKPVTHIFIDGLAQNVFTTKHPNLWSLSKLVSRRNRLPELEGNFPKYFSVYAADRNAIDALSVLTPDVMIRLRDEGHYLDYELHGTHLYIITETKANVDEFMVAVEKVITELVPQIKKINFVETEKELVLRPRYLRFWGLLYSSIVINRILFLIILAITYAELLAYFVGGSSR